MNPTDAHSHLATLRQLKEMLDAGTLTPQEFEALKQQLVFGPAAPAPAPPAGVAPGPLEGLSTPEALPPAAQPEPEPLATPAADNLDWLSAAAPVLPTSAAPLAEAEERRNPLTLVFLIGGALVLLALVLYLTLGNSPTDEHLTSTSQTAADSTATTPDIGPQTNQLTLPPAAPETIRIAPALPPPAVAAAASKFQTDSAAVAPTPSAPAKATPAATPPKAAATAPVTTDSTTKVGQP